ncbi:MAG: hypothetical protein GY749_16045 [Desulfobacteraceae bacterium]|nr:hypothetical protein [Desulfobacteraceae bacterium]
MSVTKTVHLVPTLCVGMQTNSASRSHALRGNADRTLRVRIGTQEDCFRQPETGRGAWERGVVYFGYTHMFFCPVVPPCF